MSSQLELILIPIVFLFISCAYAAPTIPSQSDGYTEFYNISSPSYVFNEIECTTPICHVTCNSGCHSATIDASLSEQLILECSVQESCVELQITHEPQISAQITCGSLSSCHNAQFHLNTTQTVDIECSGSSSTSGCYNLQFYAQQSSNVFINCNEGCEYASFYVRNADSVSIDAGENGLFSAVVHAENVQNGLTVDCKSGYSCRYTDIYCPYTSSCDILCYQSSGYGNCQDLQVYVENNVYSDLSIECDESRSDICTNLDIRCSGTTSVTTLIKDGIWKCDSYDCCPMKDGTITCPYASDCVISCDREICANMIIDATDASSLTMQCSGSGDGCAGVIIQCPASCTILCEDDNACEYTSIEASASFMDIFDIQCSGLSSCKESSIMLGFDTLNVLNITINIGLGGPEVSIDHSSSVEQFMLHCIDCASSDFDLSPIEIRSGNVVCDSEDSCEYLDLSLSIVESLTMQCVDLDSCSNSNVNFYLMGATNIDIICQNSGSSSYYYYGNFNSACNEAEFTLFSSIDMYQTASLSCNSYDCYEASFDFTNISQSTVMCNGYKSCRQIELVAIDTEVLTVDCDGSEACYSADIYCPYKDVSACSINCADSTDSCDYIDITVDDAFTQNYLDLTCPVGQCSYFTVNCENTIEYNITSKSSVRFLWNETNNAYECPMYRRTVSDCCPSVNAVATCNDDEECYIDCSKANCNGETIDASQSISLTVGCPNSDTCFQTTIVCPTSSCTVQCGDDESCVNMIIYESVANIDLSLECSYENACNYMEIITPNAKSVMIDCIYDYSCNSMNVDATYSDSVFLNAVGIDSWSNGFLFAKYANSVDISCDPDSYYNTSLRACRSGDYYLPDSGSNTYITCIKFGCYSMGNIFVETSVSDLSVAVCGCNSIDKCIKTWDIYCDEDSNSFYGDNCAYSTCGCDSMRVSTSISCDVYVSSQKTNVNVTVIIIVSSVISAVMIIVVIIAVVCICCKSRSKAINEMGKDKKATKATEHKHMDDVIVIQPQTAYIVAPGVHSDPVVELVETAAPGTVVTQQSVAQQHVNIFPNQAIIQQDQSPDFTSNRDVVGVVPSSFEPIALSAPSADIAPTAPISYNPTYNPSSGAFNNIGTGDADEGAECEGNVTHQ